MEENNKARKEKHKQKVEQEIEESKHMYDSPFIQKMKRDKLDKCWVVPSRC